MKLSLTARLMAALLVLVVGAAFVPTLEAQRPGSKPAEAKKAADKKDEEEEKEEDRWLHVTNVDVYPVSSSPVFDAEILTKNGKIVAIGRDLDAPEEAEVVDGLGYRAYPGLISLNGQGLVPSGRPDHSLGMVSPRSSVSPTASQPWSRGRRR